MILLELIRKLGQGPSLAEISFNATEDKLYGYSCREGNDSLPGVLAGARRSEANPR
jgi:hypothetical protein